MVRQERQEERQADQERADKEARKNRLEALKGNKPDVYPYSFWPEPPWPEDPDAEDLDTDENAKKKVARKFFLNTRLYKSTNAEDESGWHGVRFLGQGAYGKAGLWIHVDDKRNITEAGPKSHWDTALC
jgi:hypothetical protein